MGRRILLVDDDPVVREVLREALNGKGYETVEATNGEEGVGCALSQRPDLVISDIVMPEMNGWELCQTLRSLPSTKTIPFIFLTSLDKTPEKILGKRLGADAYLTKPFDLAQLTAKVEELTGRLGRLEDVLRGGERNFLQENLSAILIDTVEYLRALGRTGVVSVCSGPSKGLIYLEEGVLKHAVFEGHKGERALLRMLRLADSQVSFSEGEYRKLPSNFALSWGDFMASLSDEG